MKLNKKATDFAAMVLVVIGGLNWGLVGLFGFDVVQATVGGIPILARLAYILVGLAAIYTVVRSPYLAHLGRGHRGMPHAA